MFPSIPLNPGIFLIKINKFPNAILLTNFHQYFEANKNTILFQEKIKAFEEEEDARKEERRKFVAKSSAKTCLEKF